jgi:hypothetical protein
VAFLTTVLRPEGTTSAGGNGETHPGNPAMPVILEVSQSNATTDVNGLASVMPSAGSFSPPLEVDVGITAGTSASLDEPLQVLPALANGAGDEQAKPRGEGAHRALTSLYAQ